MHNRVEWVDVCKGIAILAIFIGHLAPADHVTTFVFRYHVPLFFFLSGFFFDKKKMLSLGQYTLKSVSTLLIPYAIFCVLNIVFFIITQGNDISLTEEFLKQTVLGIRNHLGFSGQLWFFTCLFTIQIMYYILYRIIKHRLALLILTSVLAVGSAMLLNAPNNPSWFFNIDSALYYAFFFCLGDVTFPKLKNIDFSHMNLLPKTITIIGSVVVLACSFYVYCRPSDIEGVITKVSTLLGGYYLEGPIVQILILVTTLLLIVANIIVAFLLKRSTYLSNIGKNTLILCGCETISVVLATAILSFFGFAVNTDLMLAKIIFMIIKVEIIRLLFFSLFNNTIPWVLGRFAVSRECK